MTKNRLEAFTDGVVAIVITLLVLDIEFPDIPSLSAVWDIRHTLLAYIVSFVFVAVIWVNHHRVFQMAEKINYRVVWANIFWLFWLTLCPATTSWVGQFPTEVWPEFFYVVVYTMWSFSFGVLCKQVVKANGPDAYVSRVLKRDRRSQISMVVNLVLIMALFFYPPIALIGRFVISGLWVFSYRDANKWYHRIFGGEYVPIEHDHGHGDPSDTQNEKL